jgi:hypothetical protein
MSSLALPPYLHSPLALERTVELFLELISTTRLSALEAHLAMVAFKVMQESDSVSMEISF